MAQDLTIQTLTPLGKKDHFGNDTYNVKFAEDPRVCYAAFKNASNVGDKKYGEIQQSEYGFKFKSIKKTDEGGGYTAPAPSTKEPRKSDSERSEDIRWGLCIKEANAYVIQNRPDLSAEDWAKEVSEYANALYAVSKSPSEVNTMLDEGMDQPIDLAKIPF